MKVNLRSYGLPEVYFLGTLVEEYSTAERRPLVKALNLYARVGIDRKFSDSVWQTAL